MRKVLTFITAILMTVPMMAIGLGDGSSRADAKEFDWDKGCVQESDDPVWYRVPLDPLYEEESPTLALYLTNLSSDETHVAVTAYVFSERESKEYDIPAKSNKMWSYPASALVRAKQTEVYLVLSSTKKIALSAKVYETTDLDDACADAKAFPWKTDKTVAAGQSWWKVDMTYVTSDPSKTMKVTVKNKSTKKATFTLGVSADCPSSGLTEKTSELAPGAQRVDTIPRSMVNMLEGAELFCRVITNQQLEVRIDTIDKPTTGLAPISCDADTLQLDSVYHVPAAIHEFKIPVDSLRGKKLMPEFTLTNEGDGKATIHAWVAFACGTGAESTDFSERTITLGKGASEVRSAQKNLIDGIKDGTEFICLRFSTDQPLSFFGRLKNIHEGDACKTSTLFDWVKGNNQSANTEVWYAIGIGDAKKNKQDITVFVQNNATTAAKINAALAFECPYTDLQDITRSIPAGGAPFSKKLDYSSFGAMATDTIYVRLKTDKSIKVYATTSPTETKVSDEKCRQAIEFDWAEGKKQAANESVWYKIGIKPLRNLEKLPIVTIRNHNTTAAAKVNGEMSFVCPDIYENNKKSITIPADGVYEKQLSRDMGNNINVDTVYIRVTADQPISIQIKMEEENEGATCRSASKFNWTSGNDQKAEDGAVWYVIDLREAKAKTPGVKPKKIIASLTNKDQTKAGKLDAYLATTCPCDAPQQQGAKIAAGATRTKEIPRSSLESFGDSVWVRITADVPIHFEAKLEDAEDFDTIYVCNAAQKIEWGKEITQSVDTAWYVIATDTINKNTIITPRITLTEAANKAKTIKVEVAYECPVGEEMLAKTTTLKAGDNINKLIERSMIESIAKQHDSVWFRVTRTLNSGDFKFKVELENPNVGDKCAHAIIIDTTPNDTFFIQQPNTTAWYRIARQNFVDQHKRATFGILNLDNTAGRITASVYKSCDSDPFESVSRAHSAGSSQSKEFGSDFFRGYSEPYIYLELKVTQQTKITIHVDDEKQITPITACDAAVAVVPNKDYSQKGDTSIWYKVDLLNLRQNTVGDGTLTIKNGIATKAVKLKGELSWSCPVVYEMTEKNLTIAPAGTYTRVQERASIDAISDSVVFVRVTTQAGDSISFRFDITLNKGDECINPIVFDWEKGHIHPAKQNLWYWVDLDTTKIPDDKDIMLHIHNLAMDSTYANADMYFDCRDSKPYVSLDYGFGPDSIKSRRIDRDLLGYFGWPAGLSILYSSSNNTHIWIELVNKIPREIIRDTVPQVFVCDGEKFHDSFTGKDTLIDSKVARYFMWNDTIPFRKGTMMCDSIHYFHVTPIVMPDTASVNTVGELKAINALPLVARGMNIYTTAATAALQAYFNAQANDSVRQVLNITWEALDADNNYDKVNVVYPTPLTRTQGPVTLHYVLQLSGCTPGATESLDGADLVIVPEAWKVVKTNINYPDTICTGVPTKIGQQTYIIKQHLDTVVTDNRQNLLVAQDTLGQARLVDSLDIYKVIVWKQPALEYVSYTVPTIKTGEAIDFTKATKDINAALAYNRTADPSIAAADSIGWQKKTDAGYVDYVNQVIGYDEKTVTMRYFVRTACGEIIPSADSTWTVTAVCVDVESTPATEKVISCGEFVWDKDGKTYEKSGSYKVDVHLERQGLICGDSLVHYTLDLKVQTPLPDSVQSASTYEGYPYEWIVGKKEPRLLFKEGDYFDTIHYAGSKCDSIRFVLHLHVDTIPRRYATVIDTVCAGEFYEGRVSKIKIVKDTTWTDSVRCFVKEIPTDSLYTYSVFTYRSPATLPATLLDSVKAVCGDTLVTAVADAIIRNYLKTEPAKYYDPTAGIKWEVKSGNNWVEPGKFLLKQADKTVEFRCTVVDQCKNDVVLSNKIEIENPPVRIDNILVGKFGQWILVVHVNNMKNIEHLSFTEDDVEWYKIENGVEKKIDNHGYYYTIGEEMIGEFFVQIHAKMSDADGGCDAVIRSNTVNWSKPYTGAPLRLVPNMLPSGNTMRLENVDPEAETTLYIYDGSGGLRWKGTSSGKAVVELQPEGAPGLYMLRVITGEKEETLRYIIK